MTLPNSGTITLDMIRAELKRPAGTITLNDTDVRQLAGKLSGPITLADFYGKGGFPLFQFEPRSLIVNEWASNGVYVDIYTSIVAGRLTLLFSGDDENNTKRSVVTNVGPTETVDNFEFLLDPTIETSSLTSSWTSLSNLTYLSIVNYYKLNKAPITIRRKGTTTQSVIELGNNQWTPLPIVLSRKTIQVGNSRKTEASATIYADSVGVIGFMNSQSASFFQNGGDPDAPRSRDIAGGYYEFKFYDFSAGLTSTFSTNYTTTLTGISSIVGRLIASAKGSYNCKFEIREKANIANKGVVTIYLIFD